MILVIGQMRTGIGFTSGVLSAMGYGVQDTAAPSPSACTSTDAFSTRIRAIHEVLYRGDRLVGGNYAPPGDSAWQEWYSLIDEVSKCPQAVLADVRVLSLLDHLAIFLSNKHIPLDVIVCMRNQNDAAASLMRVSGVSSREAAIYQHDCQHLIARFVGEFRPRLLTLRFEDAFIDPVGHLSRMSVFAGIRSYATEHEYIIPSLRRFSSETSFSKENGGSIDPTQLRASSDFYTTADSGSQLRSPSLFIRGWNFANAMARWSLAGMPRRTEAEIGMRLEICQSCEFLQKNHCTKCGCVCVEQNQLINKLALATEVCPEGKWH